MGMEMKRGRLRSRLDGRRGPRVVRPEMSFLCSRIFHRAQHCTRPNRQ